MSEVTLRMAVVSADPQFRATMAELLRTHGDLVTVEADHAMTAASLTPEVIDGLQASSPEVVLVDLDGDPAGGMRMLRLLGDALPNRSLIATGPLIAPELLLEGMKAGIAEYLPSPVDSHDVADALRRAARRLGRTGAYAPAAAGRIITFVGAKGGTGVTTAAANAALYLHRPHQRTLLLDLNMDGGSIAVAMGVKARYSIVDLLEGFHRVDESLLSSLVHKHESGVHVLAAPLLPESVPAVTAEQMRAALRLLRRHYDMIVIDLGQPYSEYGRAAVDTADEVMLMLVPDVLCIHAAKRLMPLLRKGVESRSGRLGVILNRVGPDDEIRGSDIEEALGTQVMASVRRDDTTVLTSLNLGRPVALNGGRSRFAKDMKLLAALVLGEKPAPASGVARLLRGLVRRDKQQGAH